MNHLTAEDITRLFLAIGVLLAFARFMGEIARRYHQPAILGEIIAGILLGPTVFGAVAPSISEFLFPAAGNVPIALDGLTLLAICLFLVVAGMEVDLSTVWRQGRTAITVGSLGMVIPFALGFGAGWVAPQHLGSDPESSRLVFALFLATALAISALPVVAKTLMDLNIYRTDVGMIIVAAAIFNDLFGWIIFAIILGLIGANSHHSLSIADTIWMTLGFTLFILTLGRWLLDKALPYIQAHTTWPGGVLAFAVSGAFFCAAFTEWIGIHAIFGSFLFGVALGDSRHLRERTRSIIDQFVSFIFAPLFFASIGLRVNFAAHFDLLLALSVLTIATIGKVLGCRLGGYLSGLSSRESWAIGFGMNARGAMEIILGLIALQAGVIRERMFVALVIVALATSLSSGTLMERILKRRKSIHFIEYLSSKTFIPRLAGADQKEVIRELSLAVASGAQLDPDRVAEAVWAREQIMPTGLANGLALPHARIEEIIEPMIAVGISRIGVDFDSVDGQPSRLIILILTPKSDNGAQIEILADITRTFHDPDFIDKAAKVANYTEFLALIRSDVSFAR